jgi:hypothetical protein
MRLDVCSVGAAMFIVYGIVELVAGLCRRWRRDNTDKSRLRWSWNCGRCRGNQFRLHPTSSNGATSHGGDEDAPVFPWHPVEQPNTVVYHRTDSGDSHSYAMGLRADTVQAGQQLSVPVQAQAGRVNQDPGEAEDVGVAGRLGGAQLTAQGLEVDVRKRSGAGAVDDADAGAHNPFNYDAGVAGSPKVPPISKRARLVAAAVNFGLTAYATLTVACVKLLHCVQVPGVPSHSSVTTVVSRRFIHGTASCDYTGWQGVALAVVVLLAVAMVGVFAGAVLSRRSPSAQEPEHGWRQSVRRGVRLALVDMYHGRHGRFCWETVLMLQRLVRALSQCHSSIINCL